MNQDEARAIESQNMFAVYAKIRQPMVITRGDGAYVWDSEGNRYLDLVAGGRAVTALGHCPAPVVQAICEQAGRLLHMSNDFYTEPQLELAHLLGQVCHCTRAFFCNSGAEANEAAIKLARKHARVNYGPDKTEIVTMLKSFHGRTMTTLAATGQPKYHGDFQPLMPGFKHVEFNNVEALHAAVDDRTCAVMLEPVLGESGVYPATPEFMTACREACDRYGALLILDEVQTGLGRTGKLFAYEHYDARPDAITLAKALGSGMPIGAMLATDEAAQAFVPGDHASSFGGGALAAAAALAGVRAIIEGGVVENARDIGAHFAAGLKRLAEQHPVVTEVRGLGMMAAADLGDPVASHVRSACLRRGVLIQIVGDSMLRFIPPLILTAAQADAGLSALDEALAEAAAA
ncbi:MAG: aspartate aminotransferase family protein [Armatimonadota bacterium]|nr:MAG: aspartate aminotransferase family protein [Armatimonadota bacterium]